MSTIRRSDFINTLSERGGYVDTRSMSPELRRSFNEAGVSDAELRDIAGQDQVIRGSEEFGRLFARIDAHAGADRDSTRFEAGSAGSLTRAGSLYENLRSHVEQNRERSAREGGLRFADVAELRQVAEGNRTLQAGSTGEGVRRVQQALIDMGYANPETMRLGTFDAETARAVRRFQRDAGLESDAVVGGETLGALAATAPPPGRTLEVSPEYSRLYADGRLDVTIALGFDEGDMHLESERDVLQGLRDRGFRALSTDDIRAMSAADRRRLGLEESRLDPNARYFVRDDGAGRQADTVLRLITPSSGGATARSSFERAMRESEVVLYSGHARYGTGPDFDHKTGSGEGNFVIDGRGNREHDRPPAGLRSTIGASTRSDLRGLSERPDYQLLIFNACSTEEYLHNLRDPSTFRRDMGNTDIITTTMPTRLASNSAHTLGFLDGVMGRHSATAMARDQSRVEIDTLNGFGMSSEAREAAMTYSLSGFLGNDGTRSRPR